MFHLLFNLLVFVALSIMAFGLFCAFLIGRIFRGIFAIFSRLTGVKYQYRMPQINAKRCMHLRCGARNPPEANYCRRCGSPLPRPFTQTAASAQPAGRKWVNSSVSL
jgi:ribosomal protein L40E